MTNDHAPMTDGTGSGIKGAHKVDFDLPGAFDTSVTLA
jgi:hypothetical protein